VKAFYQTNHQKPALIESGRVIDVDLSSYTLTATTEFSKKPHSGISWATPYQHYTNGEGFHFIPEVGSLCWMCFPSDGMRPFVLGWRSPMLEGDYRGLKPDMNPGDMYLGTRDDNFLILRRGGVVQIGGGPLNQRVFLPLDNSIRDFCENYELSTPGGDLTWKVDRSEKTADGKRPAALTISAREFAKDSAPVAILQIGSHDPTKPTILTLNIRKAGSTDQALNLTLAADKDGNVTWTAHEGATFKVDGKGAFSVDVEGKVSLSSKNENVEILAGKKVTVTAADEMTLEVNSGGMNLNASGELKVTVAQVKVGGATWPVLLATSDLVSFLTALAAHTHIVAGTAAPSPAGLVVSGTAAPDPGLGSYATAGNLAKSQKIKSE